MTRSVGVVVLVLSCVVACGGEGTPPADGGAMDGGRSDGGRIGCGEACPSDTVCVDGECVASRCGDGVVDVAAGEECDDGNDAAFDGCDPGCTFTCHDDAECDDANPCNGDDVCDFETNVCAAGTPLPPGTACTTATVTEGVCNAATPAACIDAGCGNGVTEATEECDDGMDGDDEDGCRDDCTFSCHADADCSDGDVCTGEEACDPATHACAPGTPPMCAASDACHGVSCDPVLGCVESLIDSDGDMHAPRIPSVCGDDCNDSDATIYTGAEELCDGLDNNCNGTVDEVAPTWYVDCDGDGFAASSDSSRTSCAEPSPGATGCGTAGEAWTTRRPIDATSTDCDDTRASVFPGATEVIGNERDEDCDGGEICYLDADDDDFRRPDGAVQASTDADCTDNDEALESQPATDCNDSSSSIRPGATEIAGDSVDQNCDGAETCYRDTDNDGYRTTSTFTSTDADCSDSGEGLATDSTGDCCDSNSAVNPGATRYYTRDHGCSGVVAYDYNCSGTAQLQYTGTGSCGIADSSCSRQVDGWLRTTPACGDTGTWLTACTAEWDPEFRTWLCYPGSTVSRTQGCR